MINSEHEIFRVKKDNKEIVVGYDVEAQNPRKWDNNLTKMVCFHNTYNLGDEHDFKQSDYSSWDEVKKAIYRKEGGKDKIAVMKPLYMYNHGGITISTEPFNDRWDSGQIGWVYVTKDNIRETYDIKRVTKEYREKAEELLNGEVEMYDKYLKGDIYRFDYLVDGEFKDCETDLYGMNDVAMYVEEMVEDEELFRMVEDKI